MKRRVFFAVLAALGSFFLAGAQDAQAYDLLNRMMGHRHGGCCEATCCAAEPSCCAEEVSCCAPEPSCCEMTCCAPEPSCCDPCNSCCRPSLRERLCDWWQCVRARMHRCRSRCNSCCETSCCESSCCAPEPSCCGG